MSYAVLGLIACEPWQSVHTGPTDCPAGSGECFPRFVSASAWHPLQTLVIAMGIRAHSRRFSGLRMGLEAFLGVADGTPDYAVDRLGKGVALNVQEAFSIRQILFSPSNSDIPDIACRLRKASHAPAAAV